MTRPADTPHDTTPPTADARPQSRPQSRPRLVTDGGQPGGRDDADANADADPASDPDPAVNPATEPRERAHAATNPRGNADTTATSTDAPPMLAVYRHDTHKLRGRAHASAAETYADIRVNEPVPAGADADAARMSRPPEHDEPTLDAHDSPLRRSLLTGERVAESLPARADGPPSDPGATREARTGALRGLLGIEDPKRMHRAWLRSRLPATVAESLYYPYTSLKYHTLLAAALLDNYRAGHDFEALYLVVDPPMQMQPSGPHGATERIRPDGGTGDTDTATAGDTRGQGQGDPRSDAGSNLDGIVPHRTVYASPLGTLRITATPGERPAAPLGPAPARSFADVWTRLPALPQGLALATEATAPSTMSAGSGTTTSAGTDTEPGTGTDPLLDRRAAMILDAQLRRIRSWSAALQYLEDYLSWWTRTVSVAGAGPGSGPGPGPYSDAERSGGPGESTPAGGRDLPGKNDNRSKRTDGGDRRG